MAIAHYYQRLFSHRPQSARPVLAVCYSCSILQDESQSGITEPIGVTEPIMIYHRIEAYEDVRHHNEDSLMDRLKDKDLSHTNQEETHTIQVHRQL